MSQGGEQKQWKVGELADATGLTVRTLHHWDQLGLVTPSARTGSGHRLYGADDVARTYQVVALRELGLCLEEIAAALDEAGTDLRALLDAHARQVRDRIAALRSLEATLSTLLTRVHRHGRPPSSSELMELIDEVTKMNETVRRYFTDEQLTALAQRRERLGEDYLNEAAHQWPALIEQLQAEMDAGTDPAAPQVQALAARWMTLLEAFDGGDPQLRAANNRMRTENTEQVHSAGGPSDQLVQYVMRANQARPS